MLYIYIYIYNTYINTYVDDTLCTYSMNIDRFYKENLQNDLSIRKYNLKLGLTRWSRRAIPQTGLRRAACRIPWDRWRPPCLCRSQ